MEVESFQSIATKLWKKKVYRLQETKKDSMWHAWIYYGSHKVGKRSLTLYSVALANWLARNKPIGGNHDIPHDGYVRTHQENAHIYTLCNTSIEQYHGNNHDLYLQRNQQCSICEDEEVNVTILLLTHWGRDKMAAIFQTTFSNAFSWKKMHEFRIRFHWSLSN